MPHSALTRWLKQGLARGECPLCRAVHKLDREYMWHFFDEGSSDGDVLDAVASARGFCADHAEQLRRIEVDGLRSTIGISDVYEHVLRRLLADLAALEASDEFARSACPACAYRDDGVGKNVRYLLDELAENAAFRERYTQSVGLCVPHFRLVWASARTAREREMLCRTELAAVRSMLAELNEHLRKQRAEFSHEPPGAESDSWRRAVWLTAGWPAPSEPAGVPEGGEPDHRPFP